VLSPSLWEGMPNSVLEGMACGRVVFASTAGGQRDVITHGETGVLIGTDALHRLGEGCLEILAAGEPFSKRIGQNARAYVATHHTPASEISLLLDTYSRLLSSSSS
ncbi:MAG TPA: glycosyltransferase family 4 protein, partial [Armatimonadota bacterium]|nr:glycosyltransferase family 4 protein [Armatimonadota bacterium]